MINQKTLYQAHDIGVPNIFERIEPILLKVKNNDAKKNPARFLVNHMEAIKNTKHLSKENAFLGKCWEVLTLLTLMECGVFFGQIVFQWRPHDGEGADMDMLVCRRGRHWLVSCKTSLRERWKQIAYEAIVAKHYVEKKGKKNIQAIGVFYCEKASDTNEKTAAHGRKITDEAHFIDLIVSPYDEETFNHCIDCILKGKSLHST
ncbi:MAG: hypothetical protein ACR2NF_08225 [Pirellulales bacterium]